MLRASLLWTHNFSPKQPDSSLSADGKPTTTKIAKTFLEQHVFDSEDDALSEDALKEIEKIVGPRIRIEEELRQTNDFRQFMRLLEKHQQSGKLATLQPPKQNHEQSMKDAAARFASLFGYNDDDTDINAALPVQKRQDSTIPTTVDNASPKYSLFGTAMDSDVGKFM